MRIKPRIVTLVALLKQFAQRGRVSYEEPQDQAFITEVLLALKAAGPDIIVLHQDVEDLGEDLASILSLVPAEYEQSPTGAHDYIHALKVAGDDLAEEGKKFEKFVEAIVAVVLPMIRCGMSNNRDGVQAQGAELAVLLTESGMRDLADKVDRHAAGDWRQEVTTQSPSPAADAPTPSNDGQKEPALEPSTRSQEASPSKAGTASLNDQRSGKSGKLAALKASAAAKKKAASKRPTGSPAASAKPPGATGAALPPTPPPATDGSAPA